MRESVPFYVYYKSIVQPMQHRGEYNTNCYGLKPFLRYFGAERNREEVTQGSRGDNMERGGGNATLEDDKEDVRVALGEGRRVYEVFNCRKSERCGYHVQNRILGLVKECSPDHFCPNNRVLGEFFHERDANENIEEPTQGCWRASVPDENPLEPEFDNRYGNRDEYSPGGNAADIPDFFSVRGGRIKKREPKNARNDGEWKGEEAAFGTGEGKEGHEILCIVIEGPRFNHKEFTLFEWQFLPYHFGNERHEWVEEFEQVPQDNAQHVLARVFCCLIIQEWF